MIPVPITLTELRVLFPGATAKTWHRHRVWGCWVKNTVKMTRRKEQDRRFDEHDILFALSPSAEYPRFLVASLVDRRPSLIDRRLWINGTTWAVETMGRSLRIGCMRHPVDWWKKNYKGVGQREGFSAAQIKEYFGYIQIAERWMKARTLKRKANA